MSLSYIINWQSLRKEVNGSFLVFSSGHPSLRCFKEIGMCLEESD